jgi:hypothetical protein
MTDLLKKAFDAVSQLPEEEQDAVAEWLLTELASEENWGARFTETQDALSVLARQALNEHERGDTEELDPDSL